MKDQKQLYCEVADNCSSYTHSDKEAVCNNCNCSTRSCESCAHFTSQNTCSLDLYDKIVEKLL